MKSLILLSGLLFLISLPSYSQINLGVKAGGNLATVDYDFDFGGTLHHRIGFHLGAIAESNIGQKAFIRLEFFHSRKGSKFQASGSSTATTMDRDYLYVPLLLGYRPSPRLSLYFGPEVGYTLGKFKEKYNSSRDFDFGIDGGVLYHLTRFLSLDLRYTHGLVKMENVKGIADKEPIFDGQNRVAQLGVNYLFIRK